LDREKSEKSTRQPGGVTLAAVGDRKFTQGTGKSAKSARCAQIALEMRTVCA